MYTLYFLPGACSLATHVILNLVNQDVTVIDKNGVGNFSEVNPVGTVPVLIDGERKLTQGVSIILYLLERHANDLLPKEGEARDQAIENMMFANSTMHPAYGRLFFLNGALEDGEAKQTAFNAAADAITHLWSTVETQLENTPFLGGEKMSPADILLAVYSRWGQFFPVDIVIGEKTQTMINSVIATEAFQKAIESQTQATAS